MNTLRRRTFTWLSILALAFLISSPRVFTQTKKSAKTRSSSPISKAVSSGNGVRFAVIGDYGSDAKGEGDSEKAVAKLVDGWEPDFIITLGDNNYPDGEASTIVQNIGNYYCEYIYNRGAPRNQLCDGWADEHEKNLFFPSLGNHDWHTEYARSYLNYFTKLPGNRRYYDFVKGPVHLFALDSQSKSQCERRWCDDGSCKECDEQPPVYYEPDGTSPDSIQGRWLRAQLKASKEPWNLVYFHHAPYSCQVRRAFWMRWPFEKWGASAVLAGHNHIYERGWANGKKDFPYFVNGTGGIHLTKCTDCYQEFSELIIQNIHGAMRVDATPTEISFKYYDAESGKKLDDCRLIKTGGGQKLYCRETGRGKPRHCPPSNK